MVGNGKVHVLDMEGVEVGDWLWCLECERCYQPGEFRLEVDEEDGFGYQMCPYEGCDGSTVLDGKPWGSIREKHPEYPEEPERGVVYPVYG